MALVTQVSDSAEAYRAYKKHPTHETNKQTIDKQTNQRTSGHAHQHLDVRRVARRLLLRLLHEVLERTHLVGRELGGEQSHVRLGRRECDLRKGLLFER